MDALRESSTGAHLRALVEQPEYHRGAPGACIPVGCRSGPLKTASAYATVDLQVQERNRNRNG